MSDDRFDGLFLNVAQQAHGIEPLLDHFFGFLRRKTDFFAGASNETVEELVLKTVRKNAALSEKDRKQKQLEREKEEKKKQVLLEKKRKVSCCTCQYPDIHISIYITIFLCSCVKEEAAKLEKQEKEKQAAIANMKKATAEPDEEGVMELNEDGTFDTANVTASSSSSETESKTEKKESEVDDADKDEEEDNTPARK